MLAFTVWVWSSRPVPLRSNRTPLIWGSRDGQLSRLGLVLRWLEGALYLLALLLSRTGAARLKRLPTVHSVLPRLLEENVLVTHNIFDVLKLQLKNFGRPYLEVLLPLLFHISLLLLLYLLFSFPLPLLDVSLLEISPLTFHVGEELHRHDVHGVLVIARFVLVHSRFFALFLQLPTLLCYL